MEDIGDEMIYTGIDMWNGPPLCHYGVKGMKWGVRHDKNHDTLGKGTRISRISEERNARKILKRKRPLYGYIPTDAKGHPTWDAAVYQGPFSMFKQKEASYRNNNIYKHDFVVKKDLKMPTKNQRVTEFANLMNTKNKKKSETYKQELSTMQDILRLYNMDRKVLDKIANGNITDAKTSDNLALTYRVFNHGMEWWEHFSLTKDYIRVMSTKYDAMVDDNNQTIYNRAENPVIIFNAKKVLKNIGEARPISYEEASHYTDFVEKTLKEKYNEKVLY